MREAIKFGGCMKKAMLFFALLLASILSTYSWWQWKEEKESMLVQMYNELKHVGA